MNRRHRNGFSLIELLISMTIIASLAFLLFSTLRRVAEGSKLTKCAANLRQIGMVLLQYTGDHNGTLPRWNAGRELVLRGNRPGQADGKDANPPWTQLLIDASLLPATSALWVCPKNTTPRTQVSYAMNANVAGYSLATIAHQGETILLAERYDQSMRWVSNFSYAAAPNTAGIMNNHEDMAVFTFVDGHAEILRINKKAGQLFPPDSMWILRD